MLIYTHMLDRMTKEYKLIKTVVDIVVYELEYEFASITCMLQIHHLLDLSTRSHYSLQSTFQLRLLIPGLKQHSTQSKHPEMLFLVIWML